MYLFSETKKQHILTKIWGLQRNDQRIPLEAYFKHYHREIGNGMPLSENLWVLYFVDLLKTYPDLPMTELSAIVAENATDTTGQQSLDATLPPCLGANIASGSFNVAAAFTTAVRIMLAIDLAISGQEGDDWGGPEILWERSKSLIGIIQEVLPIHTTPEEASGPIKASKLSARYLKFQAEVELVWTTNLAEHLLLNIGGGKKTLHVFQMVSLLELSYYETLCGQDPELSLEQSLKRGCYQPSFLFETLMTIRLLFPPQDRHWLESMIRPRLLWIGDRSRAPVLDPRLSSAFPLTREQGKYLQPLKNRRQLYQRYPHWAVRLDILFEEAEDPTPVTWIERWSERRKAPRHTFWVTFLAFTVAIMFGLAATVLAAVQLWVAYCDWQDGSAGYICKANSSPQP